MPKEIVRSEGNYFSEWQRQADLFIKHGYHKALGLSEQEYKRSLPNLSPKKESPLQFVIPVIAETRIPLGIILKLTGFETSSVPLKDVKDWEEGGFLSPKTPYVAWLSDGTKRLNQRVSKAQKDIAKSEGERGGTIFEAVALYVANPDFAHPIIEKHKRYWLTIPGSRVYPEEQPLVACFFVDGKVRLSSFWATNFPREAPNFGILTAQRIQS